MFKNGVHSKACLGDEFYLNIQFDARKKQKKRKSCLSALLVTPRVWKLASCKKASAGEQTPFTATDSMALHK